MSKIDEYLKSDDYGNSRILKTELIKIEEEQKKINKKPKRPKNAYLKWLGINLKSIKKELKETMPKKNIHKDAIKIAANRWKSLSSLEKKPYEEEYIKEKLIYDTKMEEYNKKLQPEPDIDDLQHPHWSGPINSTFLKTNIKGPLGKPLSFKTLEEAINIANKYTNCSGITKKKHTFYLRSNPIRQESKTGETSWIKIDKDDELNQSAEDIDITVVKIYDENEKMYYKDINDNIYDPEDIDTNDIVGKYIDETIQLF